MQFSGLFDSDEKEIYENDILTYDEKNDRKWTSENERYFKVVFANGCFMLDQRSYLEPLFKIFQSNIKYKITGNIFENPELINK